MKLLSVNCAGISAFKLFLLLEHCKADLICLQETWLRQSADSLPLPGYRWYEHRRSGTRGGIAVLVREGLHVRKTASNEYAQMVDLQMSDGSICSIINTYLPPMYNLGRRHITEDTVRDQFLAIANKV